VAALAGRGESGEVCRARSVKVDALRPWQLGLVWWLQERRGPGLRGKGSGKGTSAARGTRGNGGCRGAPLGHQQRVVCALSVRVVL